MKRARLLILILLSAALLCFAALLLTPTQPAIPIAILPLGRPYAGSAGAEFQVTNQSSREFVVTFRTMVKANGTWASLPRGCLSIPYRLQPHSMHKELLMMVPCHGESWRLVAECRRPETRLSSAVDAVCAFFRLRDGWQQTFEVMGPETKE